MVLAIARCDRVPEYHHREIIESIRGHMSPGPVFVLKDIGERPMHRYIMDYFYDKIVNLSAIL